MPRSSRRNSLRNCDCGADEHVEQEPRGGHQQQPPVVAGQADVAVGAHEAPALGHQPAEARHDRHEQQGHHVEHAATTADRSATGSSHRATPAPSAPVMDSRLSA